MSVRSTFSSWDFRGINSMGRSCTRSAIRRGPGTGWLPDLMFVHKEADGPVESIPESPDRNKKCDEVGRSANRGTRRNLNRGRPAARAPCTLGNAPQKEHPCNS